MFRRLLIPCLLALAMIGLLAQPDAYG